MFELDNKETQLEVRATCFGKEKRAKVIRLEEDKYASHLSPNQCPSRK